jgi:undecaprenyl diphosphate synthase
MLATKINHTLPDSDSKPLPKHVAIIMDGNGRWAKREGVETIKGHEKGAKALEKAVDVCIEKGITHLTVYAFSSENWKRPKPWVQALLGLMTRYLDEKVKEFHAKGIRARIIGDKESFSPTIQKKLNDFENLTKNNTTLNLQIALSYGGRQEILNMAKKIATQCVNGSLTPESITEDHVEKALYTHAIPDPDLLIRTSGEMRISNFLLWQLAYSEFIFVDCLWPDFTQKHFENALQAYTTRERRYGQYFDDK